MDEKKKRPTLGQLAAESADAEGGAGNGDFWECPNCGCRGPHNWRVSNSYYKGSQRLRIRVCRNCGKEKLHTVEIPIPKGFKAVIIPEDDAEAGPRRYLSA